MKELNTKMLKLIAGSCGENATLAIGEVNNICQSIFMFSTTEGDTKLSPFVGLMLMLQYCTSDEVNTLLAGYQSTQEALSPA